MSVNNTKPCLHSRFQMATLSTNACNPLLHSNTVDPKYVNMIGVSLSKSHTSGTALQAACIRLSVCIHEAMY